MNTIYLLTMEYISTRGKSKNLQFEDVLLTGLAPDGGLYVPKEWPLLDYNELKKKLKRNIVPAYDGMKINL